MTKKKQQKREDPISMSTYKIIVVGGGGVGEYSSFNSTFFTHFIFNVKI